MKRRLILLGPPGSGKGTVAAVLQDNFGLKHISSGNLLRAEVASGTKLGGEVKSFIEKGELAPDQVVIDLVRPELEAALPTGFILDGFPRNLDQSRYLDQWLENWKMPLEKVLLCSCPDATIMDRITGRRTCPVCGAVYHIRNVPPQKAGVCDRCGGGLIQRKDDSEEVTRFRLGVYQRSTEPLVEYYESGGRLTVLDASGDPESLREQAVAAVR